jgi:hypothetical protein
MFTEEQITAAAKAMQARASNFNMPVSLYVESEAAHLLLQKDPDFEPWDSAEDLALESWKLLARAALEAIASSA